MQKTGLLLLILLSVVFDARAQNRKYAQWVIDTLCSKTFYGRGYVHDGHRKAADFIASEFSKRQISPLDGKYLHPFELRVNTFPDDVIFKANGELQQSGYDFLVSPYSGSFKGKVEVFSAPLRWFKKERRLKKLSKTKYKNKALLLPELEQKLVSKAFEHYKGPVIIQQQRKFTWGVGAGAASFAWIWVNPDSLEIKKGTHIELEVSQEVVATQSQNVAAFVPGMDQADSIILICGHYDHLGGVGNDLWFPGANDNASGIAMMLDLADWFTKNPQRRTLAFVAFGGEEAGLKGSRDFVYQPPAGLHPDNISFVMNMDLMGSGEKGATIVNASVFEREFGLLKSINEQNEYLPLIKMRGKAANSDHHHYTEAGVPSFFIYLMGDYNYYHEPADNAQNLRLGPYYDHTFELIKDFILELMRS